MRISSILVHEFMSPDILSTCPHLPASAFSRNQVPRWHFSTLEGAVDCAPADLQPAVIHLYKECLLQRVPVIVHVCRCLGVSCGSFRGRVALCCPLLPSACWKQDSCLGVPLLQCVCSWSSGWMSVTAICCGLSFSAGRNKGKWWMLLPWSGLQEKWDKKKKENLQLFMYSWITQTDVLSKCNCINPYFKGKGQVMPKSHFSTNSLGFICCLHKHSSGSTAGRHKYDSWSGKIGLVWKIQPRTASASMLMNKKCRELFMKKKIIWLSQTSSHLLCFTKNLRCSLIVAVAQCPCCCIVLVVETWSLLVTTGRIIDPIAYLQLHVKYLD